MRLFENSNRFYDPSTGRYSAPDPILRLPSAPLLNASLGRHSRAYGYVGGNPLASTDPSGLLEVGDAPFSEAMQARNEFLGEALAVALVAAVFIAADMVTNPLGAGDAEAPGREAVSPDVDAAPVVAAAVVAAVPAQAAESAMATKLATKEGVSSVKYTTVKEVGHIDLIGKAHFDKATQQLIPTPHVQFNPVVTTPAGKTVVSGQQFTRAATKQDIRNAAKLLIRRGR